MSTRVIQSLDTLRAAMNEFCDALEAEVAGRWKTPLPTGPAPPTGRGEKRMAKATLPTLPKAMQPAARTPAPELSDETRQESMTVAVASVARMRAMGIPQIQLLEALRGSLAGERVAFDEKLLHDAITA